MIKEKNKHDKSTWGEGEESKKLAKKRILIFLL
jgi:hypothetical protein